MFLNALLAVLASYLFGSIPFALLLARRWGVSDLRQIGSGTSGAANVLRVFGATAGATVMLLDMAKGAGGVLLAQQLDSAAAAPAGLAAIVGHVYPVWFRFQGGKGVATACGVFLVLSPLAVLPPVAIFIASAWITKYISIGSVLASIALTPMVYAAGSPTPVVAAALAAAALIVFQHRSNVSRVRAGTERRLGVRIH